MKKFYLLAVIALFSLSACGILGGGAQEAPAAEPVDVAATVDAEASTQAVQTLGALATPTLEPTTPAEEPMAIATEALAAPQEATATLAETPVEATTASEETPVAEAATATMTLAETTVLPTESSTPAPTATSVYPSPTSPIAILLPPEELVPRHKIQVRNTTKGPVYISMHGETAFDYTPIIEYQIPRSATVAFEVPEGYYTIVVSVTKHPMILYTGVYQNDQVFITIHRDYVKIDK